MGWLDLEMGKFSREFLILIRMGKKSLKVGIQDGEPPPFNHNYVGRLVQGYGENFSVLHKSIFRITGPVQKTDLIPGYQILDPGTHMFSWCEKI